MNRDKILLAAVAVAGAAVLVLGGILIGRRGSHPAARPSASASVSESASASPSASLSTSASPSPTHSASPTPASVRGSVVTASGAELERPSGPGVVPVPRTTPCSALIEAGWTGSCGTIEAAGGRVHWVVQKKPVPGSATQAVKVRLFTYSEGAGGWAPSLEAVDEQGEFWSDATVRSADLTSDGKPEIVVGFRYLGSGSGLGVNVVHYPAGGSPTVLAHPDVLSHGSADVSTGRLDEYAAEYPHGEPNCCPPYWRHRVLRWDGAQYRAERVANVTSAPPGDFR